MEGKNHCENMAEEHKHQISQKKVEGQVQYYYYLQVGECGKPSYSGWLDGLLLGLLIYQITSFSNILLLDHFWSVRTHYFFWLFLWVGLVAQ